MIGLVILTKKKGKKWTSFFFLFIFLLFINFKIRFQIGP